MNAFERRWQSGTALAREARPEPVMDPPFGFTTRVLARAREALAGDTSLEQIWTHYGLRALAGVVAMLLVFAAMDAISAEQDDSILPRIEPEEPVLPWTPMP